MASKIRVLDENTINKIAAGEVIENPSSVVKELVENAVDAGATDITIEIKGGGRQLIRITDNGCGMNRDDALLCLERHATSKIRAIDDIHTISTMGFRGEAVPSIASISKMTLLTCAQGEEEGTLITIDGGRIVQCSPAARSGGTTLEVKSLFFNVPVRKKFQRSPAYDASEILKVVSIQALAHSDIKFQLISNQESMLLAKMPQCETKIEKIGGRISDVLGSEFFSALLPIERSHHGYHLIGYIGQPSQTRQNRTGQYLFINQRAVFAPTISYAVRNAYGTALGTNRHPLFVLFIAMDGSLVDVNVHPQKREVRLRQDLQLKEVVTMAVEEALHKTQRDAWPIFDSLPEPLISPPFTLPYFAQPQHAALYDGPKETISFFPSPPDVSENSKKPEQPSPALFPVEKPEARMPVSYQVISTLQGYLILSSNDGKIHLLDQRAAHSRILYEQLADSDAHRSQHIQNLLIPLTLELIPEDALLMKEHLEYFNHLGLQIELFGNNTFIIHTIPHIFAHLEIKDAILEIIHDLKTINNDHILKTELHKKISQAAARAAISHKKKLSIAEGQSLYAQLMRCRTPYQCPSGKPVIVELKHEEIAKQFQK